VFCLDVYFSQYESTESLKATIKLRQDSQVSISDLKVLDIPLHRCAILKLCLCVARVQSGTLRPKHLKQILAVLNLATKVLLSQS